MGALRSFKRKASRDTAVKTPTVEYPPRKVFFCDCGASYSNADPLHDHVNSCESVPVGDYPQKEAAILTIEELCKKLEMPFNVFLTTLSVHVAGNGRTQFEMDDAEMYGHMQKVHAWYGTTPEAEGGAA